MTSVRRRDNPPDFDTQSPSLGHCRLMPKQAQISEPIRSKHCQDVMVDGHRFSISIVYSDAHSGWCLEVIDKHLVAHGWSVVFESKDEALEAALINATIPACLNAMVTTVPPPSS